MFYSRVTQALAFVPVVVVALLVAESHSFPTQHAAPQTIVEAQLTLPIAMEPVALLRILNESSFTTTGPKTYRAYEHAATHPQALQACRQLGGRLALPTNQEEDLQISRIIGISFVSAQWPFPVYWISGSDEQEEGNFIDSVTGQSLNYINYEAGQPDDAGGEDCLHKSTVFPGWNDLPCHYKGEGYVCEFMDE
ncbi:hypothetical protein O3P69_013199 [Scylla paramamosain]|uniref:C-type lectin domain-containing protein n=1 Tax=Scylla paramamosain TaxID=85552 RepID=A0AAW0U2J1_SCYPA